MLKAWKLWQPPRSDIRAKVNLQSNVTARSSGQKGSGLDRTRDGNGTCACSINQDEKMTRHFIIFVTLTMLLHLLRILDIYLFPLIEYKLVSLIWWWAVNEVLIRTESYKLSSALLSYKMRVIVSSKLEPYQYYFEIFRYLRRGHPDSSRGPPDLQSDALPLSYTPYINCRRGYV